MAFMVNPVKPRVGFGAVGASLGMVIQVKVVVPDFVFEDAARKSICRAKRPFRSFS